MWVLFLVLNCCHFGNVSTEFICLHKPWGPGFMQAIGYNFLLAKAGCKALRNCSMLHGCYTGVVQLCSACCEAAGFARVTRLTQSVLLESKTQMA